MNCRWTENEGTTQDRYDTGVDDEYIAMNRTWLA